MKAGADDLGLTSDQKAKMKDIAQSFKGKMKAIKTDASLSRDQKKTQMGEVAKSHEAELKAVMTPEQFTKYSEMKKARQDNNREKRAQKQGQKQGKSRDKKGGADQDGDGQ
ncbi:MAG: hypothetical protein U5L45_20545 [Saprospiraceae bacterium]|nr:hypothetical protein [Saprospiraceae bacterium]